MPNNNLLVILDSEEAQALFVGLHNSTVADAKMAVMKARGIKGSTWVAQAGNAWVRVHRLQ